MARYSWQRPVRHTAAALVLAFALLLGGCSGAPDAGAAFDFAAPVGYYLVALQPIVAYVLLRMARQRVTADIEVVRSMDRIR